MANSVFKTTLQLMKLQATPADMPYAPNFLVMLLIADIGIMALLAHLVDLPPALSALQGACLVAATIFWVAAVLHLSQKSARIMQTLIALFATKLVISLLSFYPQIQYINDILPLLSVMEAMPAEPSEAEMQNFIAKIQPSLMFAGLFILALAIWWLLIVARICRFSLEATGGVGVLNALVIVFLIPLMVSVILSMLGLGGDVAAMAEASRGS